MLPSEWLDAIVDISDDDTLSTEVNLLRDYEFLTVLIPTIDSSTVTVHISETAAGTYYPLYVMDGNATGDFVHTTGAETTSKAITFRIGGARYIKIKCGSTQTSDRTFRVRGFNRDRHGT